MSTPTPNPKEHLALLRFEVICHIKTLRQDGQPLALCLRDAASRPWPGAEGKYYSFRTIETWWYDYASRGYQGLAGKSARADAGKSRSIDEALGLWFLEAVAKNPNTPLSVLYRHWEEQGRELPSLSSVQRFLASRGYDRRSLKAGRLESGPQKAFEAPAPNDLWMVDFACGPTLRSAEGKTIATHLCLLIDDHSRLIPFAAYYLAGDTAAFLDCLKEAVQRRGLPIKLYTDQGKPFVNHHARIVCANLGIRLLHAKPYHAWSKGKVERLIQTIQRDFEMTLRLENNQVHSLDELNTAVSRWTRHRLPPARAQFHEHDTPRTLHASRPSAAHPGATGQNRPALLHPPRTRRAQGRHCHHRQKTLRGEPRPARPQGRTAL